MSFFISFNPDKKTCGMHILQKIKRSFNEEPPSHTHLKEIKRGDDKKKQKKWDKQKAQNQMAEISLNILELNSIVKRQ